MKIFKQLKVMQFIKNKLQSSKDLSDEQRDEFNKKFKSIENTF